MNNCHVSNSALFREYPHSLSLVRYLTVQFDNVQAHPHPRRTSDSAHTLLSLSTCKYSICKQIGANAKNLCLIITEHSRFIWLASVTPCQWETDKCHTQVKVQRSHDLAAIHKWQTFVKYIIRANTTSDPFLALPYHVSLVFSYFRIFKKKLYSFFTSTMCPAIPPHI
jgi:hypothetical protein